MLLADVWSREPAWLLRSGVPGALGMYHQRHGRMDDLGKGFTPGLRRSVGSGARGRRRRPAQPAERPTGAHPLLGFALVWSAVALWAVNATVSKVVLDSAGLSAMRLAEVRATGSALILMAAVAIVRPGSLRVHSWRELAFLAVFGIARARVRAALLLRRDRAARHRDRAVIQYLAPVFVALWARFVVRSRCAVACGSRSASRSSASRSSSTSLGGMTLDGVGVAACLVTAVAYAAYVLMAERALREGRDQFSLLAWGFTFSALFWAAVQPWWSFPWDTVDGSVSLLGRLEDVDSQVWLLLGYLIVLGTIVPFLLMVTALHSIPATRVTVIAMLEPALAAVVAYAWLGEELTALAEIGKQQVSESARRCGRRRRAKTAAALVASALRTRVSLIECPAFRSRCCTRCGTGTRPASMGWRTCPAC